MYYPENTKILVYKNNINVYKNKVSVCVFCMWCFDKHTSNTMFVETFQVLETG